MSLHRTDSADILVREAVAADVPRIAALIMLGAACQTRTPTEIEAEALHASYREAFAEIAASPHNTLFVAQRADLVVGTLQVTLIPGLSLRGRKRAKIESVHVAPESRGLGIGAIMMRHAMAFARTQGAGIVELTSDKARDAAHRFYVALGFAQSHEGFKKVLDD